VDTMERDPAFIAERVRLVLKVHGLTQENLADMAGLTTRTIEKVVSGRHRPEEQTLRSIARAVQVDVSFFNKPTPEDEERQRVTMERALRKTVLVPLTRITTANEFLGQFDGRDAYRIDIASVDNPEALSIAGALGDWLEDLSNIWGECYLSQRIEYAGEFVELCRQLQPLGFGCFMGSHRQILRQPARPLVFNVGVMTVMPLTSPTPFGLVELEGDWERVD
jgi:transcriptional regulator with XRE-family HTH domain